MVIWQPQRIRRIAQRQRDRVIALLGEPLPLPSEDRAAYHALLATVLATVQPSDVLEQIWTHEAMEKLSEALRQRRFKTAFIAATRQKPLAAILNPLLSYGTLEVDDERAQMLAWKFALGDEDAMREVEDLLRKAKLPEEEEALRFATLAVSAEGGVDFMLPPQSSALTPRPLRSRQS